MRRWWFCLTLFAMGCAAGEVSPDDGTETKSPEAAATAQPLASTIPTRYAPLDKAEELAAELASNPVATTMEELAQTHTYLKGIGDPECAFTGLCGSGGGQYSGCVFGFCAWCQTWAQCFFENGEANIGTVAPCDPGPCRKP